MRALFLSAVLLSTTTLLAQWTTPDVNTPVHAASGLDAVTPLNAPGPDGSSYISWFENGVSGYVLKMQRLDVNGNALWAAGGLVVSDEPQNSALFRYDLKSDHAGNAIVAFQDERSGQLDVVAYRIAPDGSMLWGDGLALPTPGTTGLAPVIGVLTDDQVVIAWNADATHNVVFRVLPATGIPTAADPTAVPGTGTMGRPRVIPCSDGTFWMQYVVQTGNFLSPGTMTAMRYNGTTPVDGTAITISTKTIASFYFPDPMSDGHDGLYVAFNTGNAANASITDVYLQRMRSDGSRWSDTGTAVETGAATQRFTMTATPALVNEDDGLMMAYSRTNTAQSQGGIAVQRFDTAGAALLGNAGVELVPMTTDLPGPFANAPVPDGIVTTCSTGGFGQQTLFGLHVTLDGSIAAPGTIPVCSVSSGKDDATLVPFRAGQAVAVWQDGRSASGIYAQPITIEDYTGIMEATSNEPSLLLGNPSDHPEIILENATGGGLLSIWSMDGRLLERRTLPISTKDQRIQLTEKTFPSGLYQVVLEQAGARQVLRWVHP